MEYNPFVLASFVIFIVDLKNNLTNFGVFLDANSWFWIVMFNLIIEALDGWIEEELFLDYNLSTAEDVTSLLNDYVEYFNHERPAAALNYKSPVQYKTELGF